MLEPGLRRAGPTDLRILVERTFFFSLSPKKGRTKKSAKARPLCQGGREVRAVATLEGGQNGEGLSRERLADRRGKPGLSTALRRSRTLTTYANFTRVTRTLVILITRQVGKGFFFRERRERAAFTRPRTRFERISLVKMPTENLRVFVRLVRTPLGRAHAIQRPRLVSRQEAKSRARSRLLILFFFFFFFWKSFTASILTFFGEISLVTRPSFTPSFETYLWEQRESKLRYKRFEDFN